MPSYKEIRELRIVCERDDLIPPLWEYYPHRETCEPEYGIPVERLYKETEKYEEDGLFAHIEDDIWDWRILLTADVSVAEYPAEMLKKQDMILVYQTTTEEQLVECVYPLFPLQKGELDVAMSRPAIFCFVNVDAAKEFIRFLGWQMLTDCKVVDLDFADVLTVFASQRGNILCISKKNLFPQEELSEKDAEVQGALFIFRGDEQLSLYEVCGQAEKLCGSFHESTNIIWTIEMCHEQSVTALLATSLTDQGFCSCNGL